MRPRSAPTRWRALILPICTFVLAIASTARLDDPSDAVPVAITDGTGVFRAPVAPSESEETWLLEVTAPGYTEAWRHVVVSDSEERALRPITLTPLDPPTHVGANPSEEVDVASSDGRYHVVFPPGAIPGDLDVHVTPLDDGDQLGYPLPKTSLYTYAVHITTNPPPPAQFSEQITVKVLNDRGFPDGTQIPVGWYDEDAARWVHMTEAEVVEDHSLGGEWVVFPTRHFSFFDINFPGQGAPGDGTLAQAVDPTGVTIDYTYDPATKNVATAMLGGQSSQTWSWSYDARGNVDHTTDPMNRTAWYAYDVHDRLSQVDRGSGSWRSFSWSAGGCPSCSGDVLAAVVDEMGREVGWDFDYLDRPTRQHWPDVDPPQDSDGELIWDPATGRLQSWTDRNGTRQVYGYLPSGLLDTVEVRDAATGALLDSIALAYDDEGRLASLADTLSTVSWSYDGFGRLLSEASTNQGGLPDVTTTWSYDIDRDRLDAWEVASSYDTVTRDVGYDNTVSGRLNQVEYIDPSTAASGNRLDFEWDAADRLVKAWADEDTVNCYGWDGSGRLDWLIHDDEVSCDQTYDWHYLDYDLDYSGAVESVQSSWPNDPTAAVLSGSVVTDGALAAVSIGGSIYGPPSTESYSYDAAGNRSDPASSYDARHRLVTTAEWQFSYDDAGELLSRVSTTACETADDDGDGNSFECAATSYGWTVYGELAEVHHEDPLLHANDVDAYFTYDLLGRLVESDVGGDVRRYVHVGDQIESVWDEAGNLVRRYHYGPGWDMPLAEETADDAWYAYALTRDGSVQEVRNTSGAAVFAADYSPWGHPSAYVIDAAWNKTYVAWDPDALPAFQGRPWFDEVGLAWHRARWYDPETGRFLSEDAGWPFEPHPYAFGANNPAEFTDPTGEYAAALFGMDVVGAALDSLNQWVQLNRCLPAGEAYQRWARHTLGNAAMIGASMVIPRIGGKVIGGAAAGGVPKLLGPGTSIGPKIEMQMAGRGWNRAAIDKLIGNPHRTRAVRDTRHLPGGGQLDDPATAYINGQGHYVIRNDRTGDIVQVSNRHDLDWVAPWD